MDPGCPRSPGRSRLLVGFRGYTQRQATSFERLFKGPLIFGSLGVSALLSTRFRHALERVAVDLKNLSTCGNRNELDATRTSYREFAAERRCLGTNGRVWAYKSVAVSFGNPVREFGRLPNRVVRPARPVHELNGSGSDAVSNRFLTPEMPRTSRL